jgi:hypothetical protein
MEVEHITVEQMVPGNYYIFGTFTGEGDSRVFAKYIGRTLLQHDILQFADVLVNGEDRNFRLNHLFVHFTDIFDIEPLPSGAAAFIHILMQRVPEVDPESVENLVGFVEDGPRPIPTDYGMVDTNSHYEEEEAADADVNDNVDYGGKRSSKKNRKRKSRKQRRKKIYTGEDFK